MTLTLDSQIDQLRVHVVKVMTGDDDWILYSHFSDEGHNPTLSIARITTGQYGPGLYLHFHDLCKLKPNFQQRRLRRLDVYMPPATATAIRSFILDSFGSAETLTRALTDPGAFVGGPGVLPKIHDSFIAEASLAVATGSSFRAARRPARVFLDHETPAEGHIEMQGSELHLGVPDLFQTAKISQAAAIPVDVPDGELRRGQRNPVYKADGDIHLLFYQEEAQRIGATLAQMYGA